MYIRGASASMRVQGNMDVRVAPQEHSVRSSREPGYEFEKPQMWNQED